MSTPLAFEPSAHAAPVETTRSADLFGERQAVRIFVEPSFRDRQKFSGYVHFNEAVVIIGPERMTAPVHDPGQLLADHFTNQLFHFIPEGFAQDRLAHLQLSL